MLNALEPGTVILYTGIKGSSETCIYMRELFEEYFDDENGNLIDAIVAAFSFKASEYTIDFIVDIGHPDGRKDHVVRTGRPLSHYLGRL